MHDAVTNGSMVLSQMVSWRCHKWYHGSVVLSQMDSAVTNGSVVLLQIGGVITNDSDTTARELSTINSINLNFLYYYHQIPN